MTRTDIDDPVENMLFQVARCLPRREAFAVWESAVSKGVATPERLAHVKWHCTAASDLARAASALSDSGLETIFVAGMRRYRLPIRQQVPIAGHRVDALIGERLVAQLDGFEFHSKPADRRRDIRHDAALALLGYTVLRFDYFQVMFRWEEVVNTVMDAVAQGLHVGSH